MAKLYKRVAEKFLTDHADDFCSGGIKMIYAPIRRQNSSMVRKTSSYIFRDITLYNLILHCNIHIIFLIFCKIRKNIQLAINLSVEMPDFFIGFDLVGQEDLGKPLVDFAEDLLWAKNNTGLQFYFHAGETNWQGK